MISIATPLNMLSCGLLSSAYFHIKNMLTLISIEFFTRSERTRFETSHSKFQGSMKFMLGHFLYNLRPEWLENFIVLAKRFALRNRTTSGVILFWWAGQGHHIRKEYINGSAVFSIRVRLYEPNIRSITKYRIIWLTPPSFIFIHSL